MATGLIDLHAHVLPELDDGPASLPESLALLQAMAADGVTVAVASAQSFHGRYHATTEQILRQTDRLTEAAARASLPITLLPSMEIPLTYEAVTAARHRQLLGIGCGPYLWVELAAGPPPHYTERALFELLLLGYRPIINHPERSPGLRQRPDFLEGLVRQGMLVAVTAGSLLGRVGPAARRAAEQLLREGTATLVVSDAHNTAERPPNLAAGLQAAARLGKADQRPEQAILAGVLPHFSHSSVRSLIRR